MGCVILNNEGEDDGVFTSTVRVMVSNVSASLCMLIFPVLGSITKRLPSFPEAQTMRWFDLQALAHQRAVERNLSNKRAPLTPQDCVRYLLINPRVPIDGVQGSWIQL